MKTKGILTVVIILVCFAILCALVPVQQKRIKYEKWKEIAVLAETDERAQFIIDNEELYPEEILDIFYTNEEHFEFVYNYPFYHDKHAPIVFTEEELNSDKVPELYMSDSRWCYDQIGGSYIQNNGCVAVAMTMANLYLNHNDNVDPRKVGAIVTANNYTTLAGGVKTSALPDLFNYFGIKFTEHQFYEDDEFVTEEELKAVIDNGGIVFAGMNGDTLGYHAVLIHSYDENGFYVNDPQYKDHTDGVWGYEVFKNELICYHELYPNL